MDLYVMRHGAAVSRITGGRFRDEKRALTPRGVKRIRRIAKVLKRMEVSVDLILSSPLRRAEQTAAALADELGCEDRLRLSDNLKPGVDQRALLKELAGVARRFESVMIVGHEPDLSGLISVLLSGGRHMTLTMKKGGICKLSIGTLRYGRCATLEWLISPASMIASHRYADSYRP